MKNEKLKDERIEKESNRLIANMYLFMITLLTISLVCKIMLAYSIERYLIEMLCLVITIPFLVFFYMKYHIGFLNNEDNILIDIKKSIFSKCGMICFGIIVTGEFLLFYFGFLRMIDVILYFIAWGVPGIIITYYSIKNGLLIWGGNRRKEKGKHALAKRTGIGALFFGIVMGAPKLYHSGTFHAEGIQWIIGMALGWGIPFYFIFKWMMDRGEKNADTQLKDIESEADYYEEQTNENCSYRK